MAWVAVIGATGHIGTYLIPRLVESGHQVIAVSRGLARPYSENRAWDAVERCNIDRGFMESEGAFGNAIRDLRADIVIDLICFTPESARHLVEAVDGSCRHFLHIGTIWTYGHAVAVPTTEEAVKRPFGPYGTKKAEIERYLLERHATDGFPATIVHPGHIVGPGWPPINPAGNWNVSVFSKLARGERVSIPNMGMETVHHVHADDIARLLIEAIGNPAASIGQSFNAVSDRAITLRGFAEDIAAWFGATPDLAFSPYDEWAKTESEADAKVTWEHVMRSPSLSMEKAKKLLGYAPAYTSMNAVTEALEWLIADGQIPPRTRR